jgi:hypothetical protein
MALQQEREVAQADEGGHLLVQHAEIERIEGRVDHQERDQQDQRQAQKEGDGRSPLRESAQGASWLRAASRGRHHTHRDACAICHSLPPFRRVSDRAGCPVATLDRSTADVQRSLSKSACPGTTVQPHPTARLYATHRQGFASPLAPVRDTRFAAHRLVRPHFTSLPRIAD